MEKRVLNESVFVREIVDIIRAGLPADEIRKRLRDYHNNDIAQSLELLSKKERLCFILCLETNGYQRLFPMSTMRMIILMNWELKNWQRLSMRWMRMMP